jgi:hypothetical protein
MVPENVAWIQSARSLRERAEVKRVYLFRELLEGRRHHEVSEAVEDHVHPDPLLGLPLQSRDEPATQFVPLPDKGLQEDLLFRPLDLL